MSVVYRGHDTALGRDVAVKVLHPHLAEKPESRQRLVQEARAVARLSHPNILDVYDFSAESAAEAYLVTEYIRGRTLKAFVAEHPLRPPELAALVIHGLSDALASAHEAGVIHRDLKPDNVMVREDGALKLMDFGIAKLLDREERMTLTGALMGSPAHMAPEVIEGESVGPAADVFSLGTMFYLFVTGRLPFLGPNPTATLKRILDGVYEDPRVACPALSRSLGGVIDRCLARRPEARYPDAAALRDDLGAVLGRAGIDRPEEELVTFFSAPEVAREVLTARLVERLLESVQEDLEARRLHEGIDGINQVQALAPGDARALALCDKLQAIQEGQRRRRNGLRVVAATLACAGFLGVSVLAFGGDSTKTDAPGAPSSSAPGPGAESESPSAAQGPAPVDRPGDGDTARPSAAAVLETPSERSVAGPGAEGDAPDEAGAALAADAPERVGSDTQQAVASVAAATHRPGSRRQSPPNRRLVATDAAGATAPARVPVEILIRPWAHVAIGDGPFSKEGVQTLRTSLPPGTHRVRLRCPFCVDSEETITVTREGEQSFALATELAPARLSFAISPPDAIVEVEGEARAAEATRQRPFLLRTPKGEIPSPREVRYTVRMPGFRPHDGTVQLNAGDEHTEHVTLERP